MSFFASLMFPRSMDGSVSAQLCRCRRFHFLRFSRLFPASRPRAQIEKSAQPITISEFWQYACTQHTEEHLQLKLQAISMRRGGRSTRESWAKQATELEASTAASVPPLAMPLAESATPDLSQLLVDHTCSNALRSPLHLSPSPPPPPPHSSIAASNCLKSRVLLAPPLQQQQQGKQPQ